jgi:hypothetical protein
VTHVVIYDSDGVTVAGRCEGASWTGGCPRSAPGLPVACAGRRINVIDSAGNVRLDLRIEPDAISCPLVALHVVSADFAEVREGAGAQAAAPGLPGGPGARDFIEKGVRALRPIGAALARLRGKILQKLKEQVTGSH